MTHSKSKAFSLIFLFVTLMGITLYSFLSGTTRTAVAAPALQANICFVSLNGTSTTHSSSDGSAVQTAVNAANPGDTLKLAGSCVGITPTAGISQTAYIAKNLTLRGGYTTTNWIVSDPTANPTTLSANNLGRVIVITGTASAEIDSLIVRDGTADAGAGLYVDPAAGLTLRNSQVLSNTSTGLNDGDGGGGLGNLGTTAISDTIFRHNQAEQGGAIRVQSGSVMVSNSTFRDNTATLYGGGIYNNASLTLTQVDILSNTTQTSNGGGLYNTSAGIADVSQSTFGYNQVALYGGGIYAQGQLNLSESHVHHNTSDQDGGGIHTGGILTVTGTTIAYNIVSDDGGGITNLDGQVTLINSTVSHNQGLGNNHNTGGGGFHQYLDVGTPHLHLIHTTIVSNTAVNNGGDGLNISEGLATFTNTVIAYNGTENCKVGGTGSLTSGGYNLEDANTCALTATTDITNTNPLLDSLADNGGPTAGAGQAMETHALLDGSPALDAIPPANCPVNTDQRGISRPQGGNCDIGAFEAADQCFVSLNDSGTTDYTSIDARAVQTAVNAASTGDTLKIAGMCAGVVQTAGIIQTAYISKNLTLQGGYTPDNWLATPDPDANPTVLDAENAGRVVYIDNGAEVTLAGLTLQNGTSTGTGGGVAHFGASLIISDSRILSNTANAGGGIYNDTVLTVTQTTILGNQVSTVGGGIAQDGGDLYVSDSLISGNTATLAGGGVQDDDATAGTMTFSNTTIQNNLSDGIGGGVADVGGPLTLTNTQVLSNSAASGGGGIYKDFGTINLSDSLISGNTARSGGGIDFYVATLNAVSTTLQYNQAITTTGGGINNQAGSVNLLNSTLQHNQAATNGGGYYAGTTSGSSTVISNTTLYSNTATGDGGGIYADQTVVMTNSLLRENYSGDQGGGVYLAVGAEANLYDSQALSNTAVTEGGGVYVANGAVLTSTAGTFGGNGSGNRGGGLFIGGFHAQVLLDETVIDGNSAAVGGGGIGLDRANITILGGQIINNTSGGNGGGLFHYDAGQTVLSGTLVSHNVANGSGGGIGANPGGSNNPGDIQLVLTNITLNHNQADTDGGGLWAVNRLWADLTNSTVFSNTAGDQGGGIYSGSTLTVTNTSLNQNVATMMAAAYMLPVSKFKWTMSEF